MPKSVNVLMDTPELFQVTMPHHASLAFHDGIAKITNSSGNLLFERLVDVKVVSGQHGVLVSNHGMLTPQFMTIHHIASASKMVMPRFKETLQLDDADIMMEMIGKFEVAKKLDGYIETMRNEYHCKSVMVVFSKLPESSVLKVGNLRGVNVEMTVALIGG